MPFSIRNSAGVVKLMGGGGPGTEKITARTVPSSPSQRLFESFGAQNVMDAHGTDYTPFQPLPRFYNPPPFSRWLNSKFSTPHISSSCDFRASMLKEPSMDNASLRSQVTRWLPWISGAAGLLYIAMRLYWIRHRYFMVDETEHLHAAWCMAQGQIPYKDFFEHHMPLIWIILQPVVRLWTDPVRSEE